VVKTIAEKLVQYKAIEFGEFTLTSGAKSPYYVDVKSAVTNPDLLLAIAQEIAGAHTFDVVAGVAVGGVPLAVAVSLVAKKPFAIIRAAEKDHGRKSRIIGDVAGKDVLLVEDVTTTGGSARYGIEALRAAGARAGRVVTVVDREQGAAPLLARQGIQFFSLVRAGEILKK
jgi:orotate phosphoribosyltransferase